MLEKTRTSRPKSSRKYPNRQKKHTYSDDKEAKSLFTQVNKQADQSFRKLKHSVKKLMELTEITIGELAKVKELKQLFEDIRKKNWGDEQKGTKSINLTEKANMDLSQDLQKLFEMKRILASLYLVEQNTLQTKGQTDRNGNNAKILIVDDDPTTIKLISHFLKRANYRIRSSLNGKDGFKKALKERPHLILLDIMMPGMDGFQFLAKVKNEEKTARIPVVILSSLTGEEEILKGLKQGASDYITKPFSPLVLIAKIHKNIEPEKCMYL